jgi:hypothetical protein
MPFWAVSHRRKSGRYSGASSVVLGVGDRLQVLRVNALPVSAQVVKLKPFWNRTYSDQIGDYVGLDYLSEVTKDSITVFVQGGRPVPTLVGSSDDHLLPETIFDWTPPPHNFALAPYSRKNLNSSE